MKKLRNLFIAAAALVAVGTPLTMALYQANLAAPYPYTCQQFTAALAKASQLPTGTFFVAIASGFTPPAAVGDYVLGNCSGSECVITGANCDAELVYKYRISSLVAGWRLARLDANLYFGRGWKELASENPAQVKFFKSWKDAVDVCISSLTLVQCRNLFSGVTDCWRNMSDGSLCRGGLLYSDDVGGTQACSITVDHRPYPCDDEGRGRRWAAIAQTDEFWTDAQMELPD